MYKWVLELEVDPLWVADGFELDDERWQGIIGRDILPYARMGEYDPADIRREQGYDPDPVDQAEPHELECPQCGGESEYKGNLGDNLYFRCKGCAVWWTKAGEA